MRAFESLTAIVDGRRVILEDPPVVTHVEGDVSALEKVFTDYRATMSENRRDFLERYRFVDIALKVVGVGSVGTRCFVIVLEGRDENDPLILQAKEATASVLEPYLEPSAHDSHAQRVVVGQQLMQATSDIFLGWTRGPGRSRLLPPPAVGHEGLRRHHDPPAHRDGVLRRDCAAGRWPGRTPARATRRRSPPISAPPTRSTGPSPTLRRPTPT